MKRIYLDNAATTKVDKSILKAMLPFFNEKYGNASSLHDMGKEAREALENSRKIMADFLRCSEKEIIFTSSGTEADNLAIKGLALHPENSNKKHIITSRIEHPAVLNTCKALERQGYEVDYINVDSEGFVKIDEIKKKIRKDTLVVSIMHANNEIGTIQPIEEIGEICKKHKVYFHTDAVQSFGKVPINLKNIDLLSASSHKIHGPKGVGLLFVRQGTKILPILNGGGHEFKLRSSTENVPGIVGFAKAVEFSEKIDKDKIKKLRDILIKEILKIPDTRLNGSREKRLYNNVNISFRGIEGEGLLMLLNREGIYVSTGSACSSKSLTPSHVLLAINPDVLYSHGSLRITLSYENTEKEIKKTINAIKKGVERLRKISPDMSEIKVEITPDLTINEIVSLNPEAENVLLKHGIAIGECVMDMHQTIKECAKEKKVEIKSLIKDLSKLIK